LFTDVIRQAAASSTGIDISQPLVQYGAVGILASAAMFWAWTLYKQAQDNMKRERDRADRLEAEIAKLNADIHGKYIPVLTRVTDVLQDFLWQSGHTSGRGRT
jgi:hypothetical protein